MSGTIQDTSVDAIRSWLAGRIAFYLQRSVEEIDHDLPLVEIGLDSVYAMTLSGDVEERYDIEVEPTMAWDHPTVNALAGYLHGVLGSRG
ncbi:acyl carrier protein [Plantactinospora endophytica]|uniref:Phosphopantetheine attachment site domain protein n=1 Tax=Plantactinospora endophytica TaxID=673535 RepID=A0ABQ4EAK9_9ACTN|nr:acyl carrier protein [Plantactinospora endophytica]GIG91762.1 phosphopantetheine attachment site domain protein [Plantactinospora endophytica]